MSGDWKAGDVAMVSALNHKEPYRAYFDGDTWREYASGSFCVNSPTTLRPVVVIDPEDAEQVHRLRELIWREDGTVHIGGIHNALREFASPTPPKPDEPQGLGAVVEDTDGNKWIRRGATHYIAAEGSSSDVYNNAQTWGELDVVRVLSEGVTS